MKIEARATPIARAFFAPDSVATGRISSTAYIYRMPHAEGAEDAENCRRGGWEDGGD
jgi:hypothetical protein